MSYKRAPHLATVGQQCLGLTLCLPDNRHSDLLNDIARILLAIVVTLPKVFFLV